jgi:hypothetical protein
METITRDTITTQTLSADALRELVLLGLKAKRPNDPVIELLAIKPGERDTYELTLRRAPQDADFVRAVLHFQPEHVAQALNQLTQAGRLWLGFTKADMAREYRRACAHTPGLLPTGVAERLRRLDLQQLAQCAQACEDGTPWTGA